MSKFIYFVPYFLIYSLKNPQSVESQFIDRPRKKAIPKQSTHRHTAITYHGKGVYLMDISNLNKEQGDHVSGIDRGKVVMYGLSTCVWCRKTRKLLTELGVDFDYIYVDKLEGPEEDQIVEEVRIFNPSISFPTTVINGEKAIVGFKEKEIREALGF
jgi:glutaredoxin-like protein NrdH